MSIDQIALYVVIGLIALAVLVFVVIWIAKFCKMSKEEKIKLVKTYLKGLVALAEQEIVGTKRGQERLKMVEELFQKKAPMVYKITLLLLGKDNLIQLIEDALKEIKVAFEK